jgi:tRNA (guanine-N7-)-methyltransferase
MKNSLEDRLWSITEKVPILSNHILQISRNQKIQISDHMNQKKFFLEIGAGWGEVAIQLACENPDIGYVLIEKKINRVQHILKEIQRNELTNIKILLLNVNWFFGDVFRESQFSEILMNFPDPWPKLRHRKHRSFNSDFIQSILKLLTSRGRFRFATDHGGYGRSALRILRKNTFDEMDQFSFFLKRPDIPKSYFENLKIKENKRIYYLEYFKK